MTPVENLFFTRLISLDSKRVDRLCCHVCVGNCGTWLEMLLYWRSGASEMHFSYMKLTLLTVLMRCTYCVAGRVPAAQKLAYITFGKLMPFSRKALSDSSALTVFLLCVGHGGRQLFSTS